MRAISAKRTAFLINFRPFRPFHLAAVFLAKNIDPIVGKLWTIAK